MFFTVANNLNRQALTPSEFIHACECSQIVAQVLTTNAQSSPYWTEKGANLIQFLPCEYWGIAAIQNFTAARISEVAFLTFRMIAKTKELEIEAKKGSFNRVIELPQFTEMETWELTRSKAKALFMGYENYCNAIQKVISDKNLPFFTEAKTDSHIFRHYFGESHFATVQDIQRLQQLLGHQKPESSLSYIKKSV